MYCSERNPKREDGITTHSTQQKQQQPRATQQQANHKWAEIDPKNDPGSTVQWGWEIMDRYSHVPVQKQALYLCTVLQFSGKSSRRVMGLGISVVVPDPNSDITTHP